MPTSVLLAVLAAAGLLALAPALTRRYDVPERVAVERATSTARVLSRRRRRRTVPGSRPINPPRYRRQPAGTASRSRRTEPPRTRHASGRSLPASRAGVATKAAPRRATPRRRGPVPTALHRRRRMLVALVLLNLIELAGVVLVGPGFWIGFSVSFTVLLADLAYLRRRAVVTARRRRSQRRRQMWIAAQQAAVRREHDRRAAQREAVRHSAVTRSAVTRSGVIRSGATGAGAGRDYTEHYTRRALPR